MLSKRTHVPPVPFKKAIIVGLSLFIVVLIAFLFIPQTNKEVLTENGTDYSHEVTELSGKNLSFDELSKYFGNLARRKGGAYAFEVLKRVSLPPNTDFHLLGHTIGNELYKQKSVEGISICTEDFRNACSHTIVIGLLEEKGLNGLTEIHKACQKAPGGRGAYTMCFHGLGHGVLAYAGFDFPEMVKLCKMTKTAEHGGQEANECIGGAVMEIISGGFHDREIWEAKRKEVLLSADPLSPCNKEYVPAEAKYMCYTYLTPWLFEATGTNLAHPQPEFFEKAFAYCNELPQSQTIARGACFGGFGKEFIALAAGRDIRDMGSLSQDRLKPVYEWCLLANDRQGTTDCILSAMNSLYWGGENRPDAAINICSITEGNLRSECFDALLGNVSYYKEESSEKEAFCKLIPSDMQALCQQKLNTASL